MANEKIYYVRGEDIDVQLDDENRNFGIGYFTDLETAKVKAEEVAAKVSNVSELVWQERIDLRDDYLVWSAMDKGETYFVSIHALPLNTILHPDYK